MFIKNKLELQKVNILTNVVSSGHITLNVILCAGLDRS